MSNKEIKITCIVCIVLSIITLLVSVIFSAIILKEIYTLQELVVEASEKETTIIVETPAEVIETTTTPVETTTKVETTKPVTTTKPVETTTKSKETTKKTTISEEDIELLALVTVAEAEGESEYGKRLVIDTILNRVDHPKFPNTIRGVIYQKNQFTSMWNGRTSRCVVTDEVRQLVREELESRTNKQVIFFQMYGYSKYGKPLFKEGCHYFSSY
jgi:N-acetylmuramoyl-L-alanine amidase